MRASSGEFSLRFSSYGSTGGWAGISQLWDGASFFVGRIARRWYCCANASDRVAPATHFEPIETNAQRALCGPRKKTNMTETFLIIIPADPNAETSDDIAEAACVALEAAFPDADDISYDMFDEVRFIDPGVAFDSVHCPACGKDADPWWPTAMDKAARLEFDDLDVVTKCCKAAISLNDMKYAPAAGFARFAIVVENAGALDLTVSQRGTLEATLGVGVRVVVQQG
jgi:hypothetical protein